MKTFEEALAMVYRDVSDFDQQDGPVEEVTKAALQFEQIMQEALRNQRTQEMLHQLHQLVRIDALDPMSALATAFANGLRCGIEMERQPLPDEIAKGG